jgi:[protein-PII] uridylyltransferase
LQGFSTIIKGSLDARAFFQTKRVEQEDRHQRFSDTPYSLEANCKDGPGGLRDLQLILWIAQAAGYGNCWKDLEQRGFITDEEEQSSKPARPSCVSCARTAPARRTPRRSPALRVPDGPGRTARVYRHRQPPVQRATDAEILPDGENGHPDQRHPVAEHRPPDEPPQPINERFQNVHEFLDVVDEDVFIATPAAILEVFVLLQKQVELKGLTARAQRALWRARKLIDDDFRRQPENRARFLEILQQERRLVQVFRRMNQSGVLGRYLPAFGRIVGQMQHDLFHVYTVDQHILQVLRRLRRFAIEEFAHEYPLCSRLISDFGNPWVLYIAALFHDIGKGRGGDHSELGAIDAAQFCADHDLAADESELVVWLVRQHLLMSRSAQKEDHLRPQLS